METSVLAFLIWLSLVGVVRAQNLVGVGDCAGDCGLCEGDCDFDADCRDGFICFQQDGVGGSVPGCNGVVTQSGDDYCIPDPSFEHCLADGHSIYAWYEASMFDEANQVWPDLSGNGFDGVVSGAQPLLVVEVPHGTSVGGRPYVTGSTGTVVTFPTDVHASNTVFNLCRRKSATGVVLQCFDNNILFGWYDTLSGVAYNQGWITNYVGNGFGTGWLLSSQTPRLYRGNGQDFTVNTQLGQQCGELGINDGVHSSQVSDFECAEVLVFNDVLLSLPEVECIENYFHFKYGFTSWTMNPTPVTTAAPTAPTAPPTAAPTQRPTTSAPTTSEPTTDPAAVCDASAIATFDWDEMMTSAAAEKPEVLSFDMAVNDVDLSLNIAVKLTYEGKSSADIYGAVYGTTYVLDFEDFDAHADSISAPGTCQNRVANDFAGLSFDSLWSYSTSPLVDIGTAPYLAYPPPGDFWTISMADDDSCGAVVYSGKFTWNDLVACQSASGSTPIRNYITASEDEASGKLNLEGTFYVNVVSPYAASGDTGFYRVYQLLSQPFIISVNKNIQVLKGAGINLFTISVIAVYKEEQASLFKLIVLTESAEYLQLSRTGVAAGLAAFQSTSENSAPLLREFTVADSTENDGCLNNKDYICSQLWQIEAPGDCSSEQSQYIDFSGDYTLQFTPECRAAADLGADGVALHDYCSGADGWLATHGDLVTDGIGLTATLQWRDEECDPLLFEVQFEAEMLFYTDAAFATVAPADTLYQVGEDRVYIVVDTEFPDATYDVFDTTLLNVWICTFDPLTPPAMPIEPSELSGGCFSTNIDGYVADSEFGTDNAYAYHIFDSQATVSVPEIIEFELVGHPSTLDSDKDKLQFSFVVPPKIARDTLYIHAQIEVSLTTVGGGRRRMLLGHSVRRKKRAAANQMSHFLGNIGVSDQAPPQNPKPLHHEPLSDVPSVGGDHYVLSLQSPLVLAFAGLLAVILTLNIVYMAVRCCGGGERATVSLGGRSKRNYKPVNVESEVDDSEAHLNVVSE